MRRKLTCSRKRVTRRKSERAEMGLDSCSRTSALSQPRRAGRETDEIGALKFPCNCTPGYRCYESKKPRKELIWEQNTYCARVPLNV